MTPRGKNLHKSPIASHFILVRMALLIFLVMVLVPAGVAEGTRTWEQSKFEELTKGTAAGIAIRGSGGLELAPAFKALYATPSTYIWAMAADDSGNVYAATGAPARVYRIRPNGKAAIIFEPEELQVQALQVGANGVIYAATAPDGKVYRLEHKPSGKADATKAEDNKSAPPGATPEAEKPVVDPTWSSSVYFAPG